MSLDQVQQQEAAPLGRPPRGVADGETLAFKFGGSSLLGAKRMLHAAGLVCDALRRARVIVVVSAMKGVTDRLLHIAQALSSGGAERARFEAESLIRLHEDALGELAPGGETACRFAHD